MKTLLTTAAVALIATAAAAQYKTPAPAPTPATTPSAGVQVQPNPNVIITPTAQPEDELSKARRIERNEAIKMVKSGKAIYVDVRSKESYDEGHIPGAISIPLSELNMHFKDLPPHKFLIAYCA